MWNRRVLSFTLAVLLTVCCFRLPALADTPAQGAEWNPAPTGVADPSAPLLPGEYRITAGIAPGETTDEYLLDYQLEKGDSTAASPAEIVLVIDSSHLAAGSGQLQASLDAAKKLINSLLSDDSPHRVALVSCGRDAQVIAPLSGFAEREEILAALNTISVTQGCYLESGIRLGRGLFGVDSADKYLFLLGGGNATYSTRVAEIASVTPLCPETTATHLPLRWEYELKYTAPAEVIGDGESYSNVFSGRYSNWHLLDDSYPCSQNSKLTHERPSKNYPVNHGGTAVYESMLARRQGISVAAIPAESISETGRTLLIDCTLSNLLDSDSLSAFLGMVAPEGDAAGEVTLALGTHISLLEAPDGVVVEGTALTWPSSLENVRLKVRLEVEQPGFVAGQVYPVWEGSLSVGGDEIPLPQPSVTGRFSRLYAVPVTVNHLGGYLDSEGKPVASPSAAKQLAEPSPLINTLSVNQWRTGFTVEQPIPFAPEGYIPYPGEDSSRQVTAPSDASPHTEYFRFVRTNLTYQIDYYRDGDDAPFDTLTVQGADYSAVISDVPDSGKLPPGYRRSDSFVPVTIWEDGTVIRVDYEQDETQAIPYTVVYYVGETAVRTDHLSTPASSPQVTLTPDPELFPGCALESISYGDKTGASSLTAAVEENGSFHIYYRIDTSQTLSYRVDTYVEDSLVDSQQLTTPLAVPQVTVTPNPAAYSGCLLREVTFGEESHPSSLTVSVAAGGEAVFRVYYDINLEDVLPYQIEYYQEEALVDTRTGTVPTAAPTLTVTPDPSLYAGWTLVQLWFGEQSASSTLTVDITPTERLVKVVYTIDETQRLPYTIRYHFEPEGEEQTDSGSVPLAKPDFLFAPPTETRGNYRLQEVAFGGQRDPASLAVTITEEENVLEAFYLRDPESLLGYRVEYYKSGQVEPVEAYSFTADADNPVVQIMPEQGRYQGYELEKIVFGEQVESRVLSADISLAEGEPVIRVYYRETSEMLTYYIRYYYDGVSDPRDNVTVNDLASRSYIGGRGDIQEKNRPGFIPDDPFTNPSFPVLMGPEETIDVFYRSEESTVLRYSVEYYRDGALVTGDTQVGEIPFRNTPKLTISADTNRYSGYSLESVTFGSETAVIYRGAASAEGIVNFYDNLFRVYYVSSPTVDYQYSVEYYYDGVRDDSLAMVFSVAADDSVVSDIPERPREGFIPASAFVSPALPHRLEGDGTVFQVHYVGDSRLPDPGGEEPGGEETATVNLTHRYLRDSGEEEMEERSIPVPAGRPVFVEELLALLLHSGAAWEVDAVLIWQLQEEIAPFNAA
ncbi:MAG: vWA domain-containing protein [Oscillospiraceae bacterium]